MTLYWIYDLSNWKLALLIVGVFLIVSEFGLLLTRPLTRKLVGGSFEYNELVNFFFAAVGVFYGLAVGLIAVATWENYTGIDSQVSKEAAAIAGLYRDLDGYPQPLRGRLEKQLRDYTRFIIEEDWSAHRKGKTNDHGTEMLDRIENEMMQFEPTTEREKINHGEALRSLNDAVDARDLRMQSIGTGLPALIWYVVLIGAVLTIGLTYLFHFESPKLHAVLVGMLATFIALLIFLTAAMDNPFLGDVSVSPEAFQTVLDKVMIIAPEVPAAR